MSTLLPTVPVSAVKRIAPLHVVESGVGVPVVLLHGLGSSHRDWERQTAALSRSHRVIALDLRGHGASPPVTEAGVGIPELARDVARELDRRGLEGCHVVGWSLGGMVAVCLADQRPDLVRSLVIVNSPPGLTPSGFIEELRWAQRKFLTKHVSLPIMGALIARRLFVGRERAELRREFVERFVANDAASYRAVFDAITRHEDAGVLERIACPVLVVAGDRDYWPVSRKREQAARFPDARVAVVEGSGHATPVECPEIFNALLLDFLSSESAAAALVDDARVRSPRRALFGMALAVVGLTGCGGDAATAAGDESSAGGAAGTAVSEATGGASSLSTNPSAGGNPAGNATTGGTGAGGAGAVVPPNGGTGGAAVVPSGDAGAVKPTEPKPDPGSRCRLTDTSVFCEHNVTPFQASATVTRNVYWQTPLTPAPKAGYPVVFLYQGSLFGPSVTWAELSTGVPFGGFYQGVLQAKLLEKGFTVIAPEAQGGIAWQTNAGGTYAGTSDDVVVTALIKAVKEGHFGAADPAHLYATGISSGGYMTSRMAVSYPGVFRALAIQSGSYATCLGPLCAVPPTLPADHPPTLFLHGGVDMTVPLATMQPYHDELSAEGVDTDLDLDPAAGHQWLADAPERVPAWFLAH